MSTIPSPAATKWVPVGPGPMPDFRYRGDWASGNYTDGDIVVYNGVTYLCVAPTTDSPTPWAPPTTSPSYGMALPASPADGMEHVLVDSISNPTYQWRLRYNAGSSSAYKWEFIGGAAAYIYAATGGWQTLPDTISHWGPNMNAPRAGIYEGTMTTQVGGPTVGAWVSCGIRPTDTGVDGVYVTVPTANGQFTGAVTARTAAVAAGAQIGGAFVANMAGMAWANAQLRILPVRIS